MLLKKGKKSLMKFWKNKKIIWLFLIIIVGGFLRFYNLNWDEGSFFHPDERNIANAVVRISFFNQLNPHFFAYGSFPFYLYRLTGDLLVWITKNNSWTTAWPEINLIGRWFSALFSTASIFLIYLTVKKFWQNYLLAIISAFFLAFSPTFIQMAHFAITESLLVFWLLILLLLSLELEKNPTWKNYLKIGIIGGLALATKISAVSFLIIPFTAHFFWYFKKLKIYGRYFFSLLISFLTFSFFSPYVFLDKEKFWESMNYENGVVLGKIAVPYTLQFEKTIPYLFQIKNFFWQIGPVAILGILGIIFLLILGFKKRNKKIIVFLIFPIIYFIYVGTWHTKFIRYMLPILPFIVIAGAWLLLEFRKKQKVFGNLFLIIFLGINFFWSLAFFKIYLSESTRIIASRWIYKNLPQQSKILTEHWDDGLPISLTPNFPQKYRIESLTIYEPDNLTKLNYYAEKLATADYLIINSRRLYGTLMFLPEKYPLTSRYYQLLFRGNLGYQKIAEFTSYPKLLFWEINDDSSEETFQVYDHPKVIIFQNRLQYSKEQLKAILNYD